MTVQPNLFDPGGRFVRHGDHGTALVKVYPLTGASRWAVDVDVWDRTDPDNLSKVWFVVRASGAELAWTRAHRIAGRWCDHGVTPARAACFMWATPGSLPVSAWKGCP